MKEDEEALREDVVKLARRFGRYGYRMVTGMLWAEGWPVNHERVVNRTRAVNRTRHLVSGPDQRVVQEGGEKDVVQ